MNVNSKVLQYACIKNKLINTSKALFQVERNIQRTLAPRGYFATQKDNVFLKGLFLTGAEK